MLLCLFILCVLVFVIFFFLLVCVCVWLGGGGLAAVCDCGTPWTFLLTFLLAAQVILLVLSNCSTNYKTTRAES